MVPGDQTQEASVIDRIVAHAADVLPARTDLESSLRVYFAHADDGDLQARRVPDLFGMMADHLQLASVWTPDTISIEVTNPRIEVDGWESDHTVVRIVTDDMPFLVDSVSMELSRRGVGIHSVTHPVMARNERESSFTHANQASEQHHVVSLISIEIDRQSTDDDRQSIEDDLRRVLGDVRAAVRDWRAMRDRMNEISRSLDAAGLPLADEEVRETREFLDWLAATTSSSSGLATTPSMRRTVSRFWSSYPARDSVYSVATSTLGEADR